jgi:hypothetical protein
VDPDPVRSRTFRSIRWDPSPDPDQPIQGGSDISGTLSKPHRCIKETYNFPYYFAQTVSALHISGNKNKQTQSGKGKSIGSYESCDSLLYGLRAGWTLKEIMRLEDM